MEVKTCRWINQQLSDAGLCFIVITIFSIKIRRQVCSYVITSPIIVLVTFETINDLMGLKWNDVSIALPYTQHLYNTPRPACSHPLTFDH